jgi:hypothetical protein
MRYVKTASYANAMPSKKEYSRLYSSFLGVDVSSDPATVSAQRFPYAVNMWKDYKADIGDVVSTIPGYRSVDLSWNGIFTDYPKEKIYGMYSKFFPNENVLFVHSGKDLYWYVEKSLLGAPVNKGDEHDGILQGFKCQGEKLAEDRSAAEKLEDKLVILDGSKVHIVTKKTGVGMLVENAENIATVPTIQFNGKDYMTRNILTNKVNHRFLNADLEKKNSYGLIYSYNDEDMTAKVMGVNDDREVIYVPETTVHDGKTYTVTEIGEYFLSVDLPQSDHNYQNRVKTIVCAKTVTKINQYAFYHCFSLKIAVLPGVTSIGEQAFTNADSLSIWYINKDLELNATAFADFRGTARTCVLDGSIPNDNTYSRIEAEIAKSSSNIFNNCRYVEAVSQDRANLTINSDYAYYMLQKGYDSTYTSVPYMRGSEWVIDTISSTPFVEYRATRPDAGSDAYIAVTVFDKISGDVVIDGYSETIFTLSKGISPESISMTVDGVSVDSDLWTVNEIDGFAESVSYFSKGKDGELKDNVTIDIIGEADEKYLKTVPDYKDFIALTKYSDTIANAINHCTIISEFDGRLFLGGNSDLPNVLFFCDRNEQGVYDPTYFGVTSYVTIGTSTDKCKVLIPSPSYLTVIKDGNGSVYVLKPVTMEDDEYTRTYSITEGVSGVGAIGPGISFYDDKVFLSERGLDSITPSSIQLERSIVHRSLNIDRLLLSETRDDLAAARMTVWQGYLVLLVGSRIYLADSRALSNRGYEWFVLEDIYSWQSTDEHPETLVWRYCKKPAGFPTASIYVDDVKEIGAIADSTKVTSVENIAGFGTIYYEPYENTIYRVLVDTDGERQGGVAHKATEIYSSGENLFLGFDNGTVCVFNTDKRGESIVNDELVKEGDFSPEVYQRCGHAYVSGFATKLDNCDMPHLAKNTVKGSLVLKLKATVGLNAKISCRTDRETWRKLEARDQEHMLSEIKGGDLDFTRIAFDLATFETKDDIHVIVREEKRRWIEKQYYIYTDMHKTCLAVKNIAFRYNVSGAIRDRDV